MGGFTLSIKPTVLTQMNTTEIANRLVMIVMALEDKRNLVLMLLLFAHTVQGATQEVNTDIQKIWFVSFVPLSLLPL
jgi:hypothetical protein